MITDHDDIDLSHQNVPQDPDYPLKGQMPTMIPLKDEWELRADIEAEERRAQQISLADITAAEFRNFYAERE